MSIDKSLKDLVEKQSEIIKTILFRLNNSDDVALKSMFCNEIEEQADISEKLKMVRSNKVIEVGDMKVWIIHRRNLNNKAQGKDLVDITKDDVFDSLQENFEKADLVIFKETESSRGIAKVLKSKY